MIEQTTGEQLPDGCQTSEYLRDHGMLGIVVSRHELKEKLAGVLFYLLPARASDFVDDNETDDTTAIQQNTE